MLRTNMSLPRNTKVNKKYPKTNSNYTYDSPNNCIRTRFSGPFPTTHPTRTIALTHHESIKGFHNNSINQIFSPNITKN